MCIAYLFIQDNSSSNPEPCRKPKINVLWQASFSMCCRQNVCRWKHIMCEGVYNVGLILDTVRQGWFSVFGERWNNSRIRQCNARSNWYLTVLRTVMSVPIFALHTRQRLPAISSCSNISDILGSKFQASMSCRIPYRFYGGKQTRWFYLSCWLCSRLLAILTDWHFKYFFSYYFKRMSEFKTHQM